jgi:hypothetical protein
MTRISIRRFLAPVVTRSPLVFARRHLHARRVRCRQCRRHPRRRFRRGHGSCHALSRSSRWALACGVFGQSIHFSGLRRLRAPESLPSHFSSALADGVHATTSIALTTSSQSLVRPTLVATARALIRRSSSPSITSERTLPTVAQSRRRLGPVGCLPFSVQSISCYFLSRGDYSGRDMRDEPPNHALQRTRPSRHCCNRASSWAGSLSFCR